MADLDTNESDEVTIADSAGVNKLFVDSQGRIKVIAEPIGEVEGWAGERFNVSVNINLPTSATEIPFLLLKNPAASGKVVVLYRLSACLTNTVGVIAAIKMYASPTITTNGTSATVSSSYIGGGTAAANTLAYTMPTISANGVQYYASNVQGGTSGTLLEVDFDATYLLAPGYNLLFTGTPDGTNRALSFTLSFSEE